MKIIYGSRGVKEVKRNKIDIVVAIDAIFEVAKSRKRDKNSGSCWDSNP